MNQFSWISITNRNCQTQLECRCRAMWAVWPGSRSIYLRKIIIAERERDRIDRMCAYVFMTFRMQATHRIRFRARAQHILSVWISNVTILTKARVHICIKSYIPMAKWKMYDTKNVKRALYTLFAMHRCTNTWLGLLVSRIFSFERRVIRGWHSASHALIPMLKFPLAGHRNDCVVHAIIVLVVEWFAGKYILDVISNVDFFHIGSVLSTQLCIERMVDASGLMSHATCMNCRLVVCSRTDCGLLLSLSCEYSCLNERHIPRKPSMFTSSACFKRFAAPRHFPCRHTFFNLFAPKKRVFRRVRITDLHSSCDFEKCTHSRGPCNKLPVSLSCMWW